MSLRTFAAPRGGGANLGAARRLALSPMKINRVWLFDLDNTLHDASRAVFGKLNGSMTDYIERHLGLPTDEANALRMHYWRRYGATLLGLERHHGIRASHFLAQTHQLPGLEAQLRMPLADRLALKRLPGRKVLLTNAPLDYAKRVLMALDMASVFESIVSIEGMRTFGQLRPKPDLRMMKVVLARLKLPAHRCVLVEDTLDNLRPVRQLGMRTVWMQRYIRHDFKRNLHGPQLGGSPHRRPAWVCAKIRQLRSLHAWGA